jgi:hypothetical protein
MPTRTDESPSRQQDRAPQPGRGDDEPRRFETLGSPERVDSDTGRAQTDDPEINTNGSER